MPAVSEAAAILLFNFQCINEKRTGSRSFMDLGLVRESGGLVQKKGTGPLRSSSNVQNDIVQFNK